MPFKDRTQAQIAAHKSWARTKDRSQRTAAGRAALDARLALEVDPDGEMSPDDRAKAIQNARRARMLELNAMQAAKKVGQ